MTELKKHQNIPSNWDEREILRNKGQFWTPSWVADAMITYVAPRSELIFDPATGKGAFYVALQNTYNSTKKFYGIDIDPLVLKEQHYSNPNCTVNCRDFIKNPPNMKFMSIIANPPYIRHHRIDKKTKTESINVPGLPFGPLSSYIIAANELPVRSMPKLEETNSAG